MLTNLPIVFPLVVYYNRVNILFILYICDNNDISTINLVWQHFLFKNFVGTDSGGSQSTLTSSCDSTENMRTLAETFRSLRLFSPSLSLQPHFKSILLKEKIVSQSFNSPQRGIASHSPITCRAAVVYGQGEPLQVGL